MAAVAFSLYLETLLPGQELGDTASFQTIAGDLALVPRQGYPLYFALNGLLVHLLPVEPARAVNLGSAIAAALAVGLVVLIGAELGGTLVAGLVAGLLLAGSYTFWSQAIIAEVYALHLLVASACLLALLAWHRRPTLPRLVLFFSLYALGFGNHLSMILLLPGFALFVLLAAPGGPMTMLRPRVVGLALGAGRAVLAAVRLELDVARVRVSRRDAGPRGCARSGSTSPRPTGAPTMVYGIPWSTLPDRFAMYWFDLRQQFGIPGIDRRRRRCDLAALARRRLLACCCSSCGWSTGASRSPTTSATRTSSTCRRTGWSRWPPAAGRDGSVWALRIAGRRPAAAWAVSAALLVYPAWRAYDTFPAMDRSRRQRAEPVLRAVDRGHGRRPRDPRHRHGVATAQRLRLLRRSTRGRTWSSSTCRTRCSTSRSSSRATSNSDGRCC